MHIPWASPHDDEQQHSWARHCYCDIQARRALALRPRRVQCLSCRLECPHRMRIFFAHKYFQLLRVTVTIFTHNTGWQYCNLQQCLFLWNSSHHEWASKRAKMTENVKNQHWEFSQTPLERKKAPKQKYAPLSLFFSLWPTMQFFAHNTTQERMRSMVSPAIVALPRWNEPKSAAPITLNSRLQFHYCLLVCMFAIDSKLKWNYKQILQLSLFALRQKLKSAIESNNNKKKKKNETRRRICVCVRTELCCTLHPVAVGTVE